MPQLNPAPWLYILLFSWVVFIMMIPPKVTAHMFPNEPSPVLSSTSHADMWQWPWH